MTIDKASLTTKTDRSLNHRRDKHNTKMLTKAQELAKKYYGTDDLKNLTPSQLDKIITWTTKKSPDQGKSKSRKAEMALRNNKRYQKDKTKLTEKYQGLVGKTN